jgi:hypothetical protein
MEKRFRQRAERDLRRRKATRQERPTVLIGCEGHTEKEYFLGFRRAHRIPNIHLHVTEPGADPSDLLKRVEERFQEDGGEFDAVYCLFDRDEHHHFEATCKAIAEKRRLAFNRKEAPLTAITSDPSFDLWLLLHFRDRRAALGRAAALRLLQECCPKFEKGKPGCYELTCANLDTAIARDASLKRRSNPSTEVGELILKLRELWNL